MVLGADASPMQWEKLIGVPLDTNDNVNLVVFASPSFQKINDVLAGVALTAFVMCCTRPSYISDKLLKNHRWNQHLDCQVEILLGNQLSSCS